MIRSRDAIETIALTRAFKARQKAGEVRALQGIDLVVHRGECFGLLGPNGAGKSTLIKILTTLLLPTSGRALVAGYDVATEPLAVRRRINLVSGGDSSGYGILTVRETLHLFSQFYGVPRALARKRRMPRPPEPGLESATFSERLRMNLAAVFARAAVRVRATFRESSWVVGETLFPFLAMSAFVLVYRGLRAPREYEGFVVLGGAMIAYWNNVLWSMASQFFWEKEQGQLQLYLITPVSRMSILLGMALGGIVMTTTRAAAILTGGILLFHVSLPLERALPAFGLFVLTLGAAYSLGMTLSSFFLLWGREVWHTATLFQEPVYLLSGFYFPVSAMGVVVGALASLLPVTLGLDGIRQVFYGPAAHGLLPLPWIPPIQIALTALFLHLSRVSLRAMENLGKREGRLTLRGD